MDNTSGQGKLAAVPPEVDRWNWGAFLLNWIWGIGNNTFIALLMFIPFANLVMPFVLGAKGSVWAWRNKRWDSVEHFKRVQRAWARWGLALLVLGIAFSFGLIFILSTAMKSSDAYQLAYSRLESNKEAMAILGPPISTGFVQGSISTSGPSGKADISFSVQGQKASGTVYLDATKYLGTWKANRIELAIDGSPGRIDLNQNQQSL
jgi:hypothetical protein